MKVRYYIVSWLPFIITYLGFNVLGKVGAVLENRATFVLLYVLMFGSLLPLISAISMSLTINKERRSKIKIKNRDQLTSEEILDFTEQKYLSYTQVKLSEWICFTILIASTILYSVYYYLVLTDCDKKETYLCGVGTLYYATLMIPLFIALSLPTISLLSKLTRKFFRVHFNKDGLLN